MAEPILEVILAQLATELAAITTGNGYAQTVALVDRTWPNETVLKASQPAIYLFSGEEKKFIASSQTQALGVACGEQGNLLELHVVFLAKCAGKVDRETVGRRFYADIESVLVTTQGRVLGGAPVQIHANTVGLYVAEIYGTQSGGHAIFDLQYSTKLGDPRQGVA
jgi:hypothetical protein